MNTRRTFLRSLLSAVVAIAPWKVALAIWVISMSIGLAVGAMFQ